MKRIIGVIFLFVMGSAQAALIDRGEGFIYDDVLDVTWAQNANISGLMDWDTAVAWADGYSQTHSVYGTFDDWRLPTVTDTGASKCDFAYTGTDCGYNVDTSTGEMASLFYDTLGNIAYYYGGYWSGTEYAPPTFNGIEIEPGFAWFFRFDNGFQGPTDTSDDLYALAVRSGDVAASVVPVPAAVWLFGSALAGLMGFRRVRR
jgi:hypothetical protein